MRTVLYVYCMHAQRVYRFVYNIHNECYLPFFVKKCKIYCILLQRFHKIFLFIVILESQLNIVYPRAALCTTGIKHIILTINRLLGVHRRADNSSIRL